MDAPSNDVVAAVAKRRGWDTGGSSEYSRRYAPRQACRWTDKEDFDLVEKVKLGVSKEWIASSHYRSLGAIASRLRLPERALAGAERYKTGTHKSKQLKRY